MQAIDTRTVGSFTVELHVDEDGADTANPREWTQLGTMVCGHRDYLLGDVQVRDGAGDGWGSIRNYLIGEHDAIAETIMPLYLFDHSGLSMSTSTARFAAVDGAGWDWGLVGYIFATPKGLHETGADPEPASIREQLAGEVAEYDSYLRGEVYGYVVIDGAGEPVESCWGFLGDGSYALEDGIRAAAYLDETAQALAVRPAVGL